MKTLQTKKSVNVENTININNEAENNLTSKKMETQILKDFEYRQIETGIEITKYKGSDIIVDIPETIDNQPVVSIGKNAFFNKNLENITIPTSVKHIRKWAFAHNNLENITIPTSVKHIRKWAFAHNNLENITIPPSIKRIGKNAFVLNKLEQITIPPSLETQDDNWSVDFLRQTLKNMTDVYFAQTTKI